MVWLYGKSSESMDSVWWRTDKLTYRSFIECKVKIKKKRLFTNYMFTCQKCIGRYMIDTVNLPT